MKPRVSSGLALEAQVTHAIPAVDLHGDDRALRVATEVHEHRVPRAAKGVVEGMLQLQWPAISGRARYGAGLAAILRQIEAEGKRSVCWPSSVCDGVF